jgi:hypothetical protein
MTQEVKIDLWLSGFYDPQCDNMNGRDLPLTLRVATCRWRIGETEKWVNMNIIDRIAIPNQ